jgi:hypothetical protein
MELQNIVDKSIEIYINYHIKYKRYLLLRN